MIDVLNELPCHYLTFGNHEADLSPSDVVARMAEFKGKWINTNMTSFPGKSVTHDVITLTGDAGTAAEPCPVSFRVGLLGLLMDDPGVYKDGAFGGAKITPIPQAAKEWVAKMRNELKCDVVVPLTHQSKFE